MYFILKRSTIFLFKDKLKNANISIIEYSTNINERKQIINNTELIIYVCCDENEIQRLASPLQIGFNDKHHFFNQIHYISKYSDKLINIVFKNDMNNCAKKLTYSFCKNKFDCFSDNSYETDYFQLPMQNKEFLKIFINEDLKNIWIRLFLFKMNFLLNRAINKRRKDPNLSFNKKLIEDNDLKKAVIESSSDEEDHINHKVFSKNSF